MKVLVALILSLVSGACTPHFARVEASTEGQSEFKIIEMGLNVAYLLDPRTETCVLVYAHRAATNVDCAKLARNVPEAREFLTWVPREEIAAVAAEPEPEEPADAEQASPSPQEEKLKGKK